MTALKRFAPICSLLIAAALLMLPGTFRSLQAAEIGTLRGVTGAVDIMAGGKLPSRPVKSGDKVSSGDFIRTKSGGFAEVVYSDGTVLRISPRSRVDVGEHFSGKSPDRSEVRLTRGKLQAVVDLQQVKTGAGVKKFEVRTPNAIAGVRGTNFFVSHERSVTGIFVQSGSVYSFNPGNPSQQVILTPGTLTTVHGHRSPSPPRPALPNEIRQMEQGVTPPSESGAGAGPGASPAGTGSSGDTGAAGTTGATSTTGATGTTEQLTSGAAPVGPVATTSGLLYAAGDPLATLPSVLPAGPVLPPPPPPPPAPTPPPPIPPVSNTVNVKINVNF